MAQDRVVFFKPNIDDRLCLLEARDLFRIQNFVAQNSAKAFSVTVLPNRARIDFYRLITDNCVAITRRDAPDIMPTSTTALQMLV